MHLSLSASLLALAAATANAVAIQQFKDLSYLGNWNVTLERVKTDDSVSDTLTAKYTNATNPKGVTHDCEKFSMPGKEGKVSCNGPFTYYYNDTTIYVREFVQGLGKVYSGHAPLTLETSADDTKSMEGHVIIPVSSSEDSKSLK